MTLPLRPGAIGETRQKRLEERRRLVERALSAARQHPVSRPLMAELVPSRMWRLNLRTILRPAEWTALSDAVAAAADRRCEICGGVGPRHPVEAHEVWAWAGHTQRLTRLVALCPRCHVVKHAGRARKLGWKDDVVDQLRKVNGWTKPQVSGHLKDAWDDWAHRNASAGRGSWTCPYWASRSPTSSSPGPRAGQTGDRPQSPATRGWHHHHDAVLAGGPYGRQRRRRRQPRSRTFVCSLPVPINVGWIHRSSRRLWSGSVRLPTQ